MEHKTKFKVGDTAWFLHDNKVASEEVRGMKIVYQIGWYQGLHTFDNEPTIELELGSSDWGRKSYVYESSCFHSKEELLRSL